MITGLLGASLSTDDRGHTNILLLGVGGKGHEGENLTDTIIIASIDQKHDKTSMLSIPRDLFVKSSLGNSRINELYTNGKQKWGNGQTLEFVQNTLSDIFAIPIHYTIKIDFEAFKQIVDAIDGIDVYVEKTINDPMYPDDKTFGYDPFYMPKGLRHFNGTTALKYVRSRKTSSDFDRSKRQQQLLMAIKEKINDRNSYSRERLIKQLYYSLTDHIEMNLSIREILSLANFGRRFDSKNLSMANLNDDPFAQGGFLYTPARDLYGGASVLIPASDKFDAIQQFIRLIFYGPANTKEFPAAILNGTRKTGLASRLKIIFLRFGIEIPYTGNAKNPKKQPLQTTTWYILDSNAMPLFNFMKDLLQAPVTTEIPQEYLQNPNLNGIKIILELGEDASPEVEKLDIFRNVVFQISNGSSTANGSTTPENPQPINQ